MLTRPLVSRPQRWSRLPPPLRLRLSLHQKTQILNRCLFCRRRSCGKWDVGGASMNALMDVRLIRVMIAISDGSRREWSSHQPSTITWTVEPTASCQRTARRCGPFPPGGLFFLCRAPSRWRAKAPGWCSWARNLPRDRR